MIRPHPLTADERRRAVRNLYLFNAFNGVAYMCVGETVVALLAVKLGCSDALVASLGTMLYLGFALLPLGRLAAARWGAARSEGLFWFLRNLAALLIASAVWWGPDHPAAVAATILAGSFLFYGCRAAGVVLQQPLVGEITLPDARGRVIGVATGLFYAFMCVGLVGVTTLLRADESPRTVALLIAVGSAIGFVSSWFLSRIDESEAPRASARVPILRDVRALFSDARFRRFLTACVALNVTVMAVWPPSLLVLKRGYGHSDFEALLLSAPQWIASALGSFATASFGRRFGPRKELLGGFLAYLSLAAGWALLSFAPSLSPVVPCSLLFFALGGLARAFLDNGISHYYLASTPAALRMPGSIVLYLVFGVVAGLLGIALSASIMHWATDGGAATAVAGRPEALAAYRRYFLAVGALLLPALAPVLRIVPLREDLRARIRLAPRAPHHR